MANPARISFAVPLLVRSFLNYPMIQTMIPDTQKRERISAYFHQFVWNYGIRYGYAYLSPHNECAAVVLDHIQSRFPPHKSILAGAVKLFKMGPSNFKRFYSISMQITEHHFRLMPEPHTYLTSIATDPKYQGQGHASKILNAIFALHPGPYYLETFKESNIHFYKKHGFELLEQVPIKDQPLTLYAMRRP